MGEEKRKVRTMKKIIILHGWTKNLDKWSILIKELEKKGVSVELLRIPALTKELKKVWGIEDYVSWLSNIANKKGEKIILIGHSNGGKIALSFAKSFPQKIEKLILIDSAGIYHNELRLRLKRLIFKLAAKAGKKITSSEKMKNLLYKIAGESDYKDLDDKTKQTMINLISVDLKPILPQIKIPTLIIWGADDRITPLSDGILMNELIKNSELKIIKNARHSPQFTDAEEVSEIITKYLTA